MLSLRPGEGRKAAWAVAFHFLVLFGYFLIRPVREALGVERGMSELRSLFLGTLVVTLLANPVYGWVVSRWDRRTSLPVVYHVFVSNLLLFAALLHWAPDIIGVATGRTFFVWLSVFNLFSVTMFWTLMADGTGLDQAKRLFPIVAVGGTVGAAAGSAVTSASVEALGHTGLLLASAVCLELAVLACRRLTAVYDEEATTLARAHETGALPDGACCVSCGGDVGGARADGRCPVCAEPAWACLDDLSTSRSERGADEPRTGALEGLRAVLRSPYLVGVAGYILLLTVFATFLYFAQARIVLQVSDDTADRTALFANIELVAQLATLAAQLFLTGRLIRRLGVGWTLTILPAIAAGGFVVLGLGERFGASAAQAYVTIAVVMALYRAGKFAIARPARETLYTVVPRDEKYKAKAFVDTFVYRAGDAATAGADAGLAALVAAFPALFSSVVAAVAVTVTPFAIGWAGLGLWLGAKQARMARAQSGAARAGSPAAGAAAASGGRDDAAPPDGASPTRTPSPTSP